MPRYIGADALLKDIEESVVFTVRTGQNFPEIRGANKIVDRIKSAPIADVQEAVRCKDCKFRDGDGYCEGTQNGLIREYTKPDDFCSYGERKDADE